MYRTKYVIAGKWVNNENTEDTFPITAENIKILVRDSNYEKENLTKGMLRLMLDKNFMDKLILLANNASIFLYCEKVLYDQNNQPISSTPIQTDWSGEYTYVASNDINYNKEIDYMGDNAEDKKDVYKQIMLGIFFKEANERNNGTENRVIRETSIQNTVIKSMDSMPLLIEPFDYNNIIDQLAIPPQESLVKFIDFMNQYKVFYETPYRFFIDAKCVYLLSSSGQATECKDEKYSSVYFNVFSLTQTGGFIEGMEDDDTNKRYDVPILVKDTNYTMDKTRSKYMNEIEAIMDPAKENSILNATELNNQLEQIKQYTVDINNKIKAKIPELKKISVDIRNIEITTIGATDDVKESLDALSKKVEVAKAEINKVATPKAGEQDSFDDPSGSTRKPTTTSGGGGSGSGSSGTPAPQYFTMNGTRKQYYFDLLTNSLAAAQYQGNEFYKAKDVVSKCSNTTIESLMHTAYIPSAVNSVSLINVFENKNLLSKFSGSAKSFCSTNQQQIGDLFPILGNGKKSQASASTILNAIKEIRSAKLAFMSQCPNATDDGTDFQSIIDGMTPLIEKIQSAIGSAGGGFDKYNVIPSIVGKVVESVAGEIGNINKLTTQVSGILTEFQASWQAVGNKINSNIAGVMKGLSNAGGIVNSLSSLKFGSLEDIFGSLNKIKDISQLGRVGLSCFDLKLDGSGKGGRSIVKVDNDNYNILKNIKANIENKDNRIVLNKLDLDAEVFTPNKEFIIHNYDAHCDKDGFFILQRKVEIYIREDKEFNCTTMLEFDKIKTEPKDIAEKAGTTAEQTTREKIKQNGEKNVNIKDIIKNGRDIINTVKKNGISIDSIVKATKTAKQIEESIRKMGSKQGASPGPLGGRDSKDPFIIH